jgi:predicted ATP-grasp superfamily ATP-dependent carboligase
MKATVPVVVVGGSLNALGVVRSLSHGGMPIAVVGTSRRCAAAWSRHCRFIKVPTLERRPLVDQLKSISGTIGQRPVLLLTDDRTVETVSRFRDELTPWFRFDIPSADMVTSLADKVLFHKLAEREGLPVPRSVVLESSADLDRLGTLTMPVVIKSANKSLVLNGQVAGTKRADTPEQARAIAEEMLVRAGNLIVQEWIVGPDTEIFFSLFVCASDSKVVACLSGRKVVCVPPDVGSTALCVAAQDQTADELRRLTEHFISLVRYQGIGSMEYKRDKRTGQFVIVEPTVGRTDWQEEIATLCGVNIPLIAYHTSLGQIPQTTPDKLRHFAWRSSRAHRSPPGELMPGTRIVDGYFRFTDPLPALYFYGFERLIARIGTKVRRLVMQSCRWLCRGDQSRSADTEVEKTI